MIIELDTQFLLDNNINAHQFIIAKLISDNNISLLKKYMTGSNSYNELYKDLSRLSLAGFVENAPSPGDIMSFEKIKLSKKFLNNFSFDTEPFQNFHNAFPIKVMRKDGNYDYLRVDRDLCKKLYHNLIRRKPSLHEHIMKCLKIEIEDRTLKGQLSFMKRMPTWLTSESWKTYEDYVKTNVDTTLEDNTQAYGTNIE